MQELNTYLYYTLDPCGYSLMTSGSVEANSAKEAVAIIAQKLGDPTLFIYRTEYTYLNCKVVVRSIDNKEKATTRVVMWETPKICDSKYSKNSGS